MPWNQPGLSTSARQVRLPLTFRSKKGLELLAPIAVPSCDQDEELSLVECSQVV
jgi:hypothetical protein